MSRTCLRRFRLGNPPQLSTLASRRSLHASAVRHTAAVDVHGHEHDADKQSVAPPVPPPPLSPREIITKQKMQALTEAVTAETRDPGRVWGCYVDLLNYVGPEDVPLDLHQRTLRRCSSRPWDMRAWIAQRLGAGRKIPAAHLNEVRFRAIMFNIRAAGYTPDIEDYHHVLRHFAAVGYHFGALQVLRETVHLGLPRSPKTYGLCLMAMCHRLTLPCKREEREQMLLDVSTQCAKLLKDMWTDGVPVTAINVDLAMRVLKQSMDLDVFERMMRVAYAIDLAYPDRPPIEFWDRAQDKAPDGSDPPFRLQEPLPFTTSTLNTVVDFLGSVGEISKLVQAVEVLTTPLSSSTPAAPPSTYEDDEDDDFGDSNPSVAPYTPPTATPNTTTYYFLLKWLSKAGRASLARHYLLEAMELDRAADRRLRGDCMLKSPGEILAPHFGVGRSMILPIFAEANRDKNMELMRWVLLKAQRVLRRKRADIAYYSAVEERWSSEAEAARAAAVESGDSLEDGGGSATLPPASPCSASSSASSRTPHNSPDEISPNIDLDLDAPPDTPAPPKLFDIYKHLSILRRDRMQLEDFEQHILDILGRNSQRVKERLGRRVWAQKDLYLRTEGMRLRITRIGWRKIVNFRPKPPRRGDERRGADEGAPGQVAAFRGFFTSRNYEILDVRLKSDAVSAPRPDSTHEADSASQTDTSQTVSTHQTASTPDATKSE